MLTQGVYDKAYPTATTSGGFHWGAVTLSCMQIFIVALTAVLLIGLNFLVFKTRIGRAMCATAQDKVMAALVGVNANRINRHYLCLRRSPCRCCGYHGWPLLWVRELFHGICAGHQGFCGDVMALMMLIRPAGIWPAKRVGQRSEEAE